MFFLLISFGLIAGLTGINYKETTYAFTNDLLSYREKLAYINQNYENNFSSRIIVKSYRTINDKNTICSASGFAGLNVLQYENEDDALNAIEYYSSLPYVEYAEQDIEITINDIVNYDQNFELEGLEYLSWGSELLGISTYQNYILEKYNDNLPEIFVAVLDTGIDTDNEFLKERIAFDLGISYYDSELYLSSSSNYKFEDDNSHGTHVAGTIVDLTLDNVKIIPIKVLNGAGSGSVSNIISGIEYVLSLKNSGTNICAFNMSLGGYGNSQQEEMIINSCYDANIMPVVAAGNSNYYAEKFNPANCEKALTISALSQNEHYENFPYIASYSNYGEVVDLCLPGTNILSCVPNECKYSKIYTSSTGGKYAVISGTSMATPHATALVSLYATYYGDLYNVVEVETKIKQNTYDFGDIGKDDLYGYGVPSMALAIDKYTPNSTPTLNYGIINSSYNFNNTISVEITNNNAFASNYIYKIYYSLDGSYPTLVNYKEYNQSIEITDSSLLRFIIYMFDENGNPCGDSDLYEVKYNKDGQSINNDGTGFEINSNGILTKYTSSVQDIEIPEYINGVKVKGLSENLFYGLNITSVKCDYDINIGYYPIVSCGSLKTLNLNSSNANYLAKNCFSLKEITLPNVREIKEGLYPSSPLLGFYGSSTFSGCFNLEAFRAPKIIEIKDNVFSGFEKLKTVDIDWQNIYSIGDNAFDDCPQLNIDFTANKLNKLGKYAFYRSGINSFVSESLEVLNESTFSYCENLENIYLANIKTIYSYAVLNSNNLKVLFLGDNDIKLYNNSLSSSYLSDFTIYCYNTEYISNFTTQTCIDINPLILEKESENITLEINGYSLVIKIYRSSDDKLSNDDVLINVSCYNGLNINEEYNFNYLGYGENYYIVIIEDEFKNTNSLTLNKVSSNSVYDIIVNSNINKEVITSSSFSYFYNDFVELVLNDIDGYTLDTIFIDGIDSTNLFVDNKYNFTMPNKNIIIEVSYLPIYYNIDIHITGNGNCVVVDEQDLEVSYAIYQQNLILSYSSLDSYISSIYYTTDMNSAVNLDINFNSTSFKMPDSDIIIHITFKQADLSNFNVNYDDSNYTYSIYDYSGNDTIVQIPQIIVRNGAKYRLNLINNYCFYNCTTVEQVEVLFSDQNKDITLGGYAFGNCTNLKNVNVGDIISLQYKAFSGCSNLIAVDLSKCIYVDRFCFNQCYNLIYANLSSCSEIKQYAFYDCISLSEVLLSKELEYIPDNTFGNCTDLKNINLENVKKIGSRAFGECKSLEFVDLSNCEEFYSSEGNDAGYSFYMCTSLVEVVNSPKLKIIPQWTFASCFELEKFNFLYCEEIYDYAFWRNTKFENINLNNIKKIQGYPFINATAIRFIFGNNEYLISQNNLEICFGIRYIYIDKSYTGNIGSYLLDNYTYNYDLDNYKVYTRLNASYVTFKFSDGTIIGKELYSYGNGINFPAKYQDKTYIYNIINWKNVTTTAIVDPNETIYTYSDVVFIVNNYTSEYVNYFVNFYYGYDYDNSGIINDDGDIFYTISYHYGESISPLQLLPIKNSDIQFNYKFKNWINNNTTYNNNNLPNIYEDINFYANYENSLRKYTISWYNGDNVLIYSEDIEYGIVPEYKLNIYGNPTKTSNDANNIYYTFNNWYPIVKTVDGECSYVAEFAINHYEYVIKYYYGYDYDKSGIIGDVGDIYTTKTYLYYDVITNEILEHSYINLGISYTFRDWNIDLANKTIEQTYSLFNSEKILEINATYNEEVIFYKVSWYDGQNDLIYTDYLSYGDLPLYNQNQYGIPQKSQTNYFYYEFNGWDKEIVNVIEDCDYFAKFIKQVRLYDIIWLDGNNDIIYTDKLPYESNITYDINLYGAPTKNPTDYYKYKFARWINLENNEIVLGDKTFISEFKAYNKVSIVNDNYQIVDVSNLLSINSVFVNMEDINDNSKLEIKFKNISLLLNESNIKSLKIGNDLGVTIDINYEQVELNNYTKLWSINIKISLDNNIINNLQSDLDIDFTCSLDERARLKTNNNNVEFIKLNSNTISFSSLNTGEFIYGIENHNNSVVLIIAIASCVLIISSAAITIFFIRKKRLNKK